MKNQTEVQTRFKELLAELSRFSAPSRPAELFSAAIAQTVSYLDSEAAVESLRADPYWPKWNSPWWHMTLLFEMGLADRIGERARKTFQSVASGHYLSVFPLTQEEIPPGCDTTRNIYCHCALGTALQILEAGGAHSDEVIAWVRPWFARYQIADGGYNCAESVYLKETPRSSIVSTLPMLEALLKLSDRGLSDGQEETLDRGVQYLLNRRLFRSMSKKNSVIDPDFLLLTFPRFYEYDVLRGLKLVTDWAVKREKRLQFAAIEEAFHLIASKLTAGQLSVERQFYAGKRTLARDVNGEWTRGHDVSLFPLLEAVGVLGSPSPFLTNSFARVVENLQLLETSERLEH